MGAYSFIYPTVSVISKDQYTERRENASKLSKRLGYDLDVEYMHTVQIEEHIDSCLYVR